MNFNILFHCFNSPKQKYFEHKYQTFRGNPKNTWKLTNDILGKSKNYSNSISLIHENKTIDQETELANTFNNYFVNIGHNLIDNINNQNINPLDFMGERTINSFVFLETDNNEIYNFIQNFKNKKTRINNIPIFVLKKVSHVISPFLSELFNESIIHGKFPNKLKIGRVIPIHKSGPTTSLKNYRPTTTLSVFFENF